MDDDASYIRAHDDGNADNDDELVGDWEMSGRINEADCWNMIRSVIRTVTERTTTAPTQQLHDVSMVAIVDVSMVVNFDMNLALGNR
jgi:hypothetical protein